MKLTTRFLLIIGISIVLFNLFSVRSIDDRYYRSINGDAKAYYAYLPALFIYNDPTYNFTKQIEKKYYPQDNSQYKDFTTKQKNGKSVNKTFPGLSLLYAPFFALSYLISFIFGFATDGYSIPFQWGIAVSHAFYFFLGIYLLDSTLKNYSINTFNRVMVLCLILFGTNVWHYLVYDHTVSHIHSLFLSSLLLWLIDKWVKTTRLNFLGWTCIIIAIIVITRPTNAIMLSFFPLLLTLNDRKINEVFLFTKKSIFKLIPFIFISLLILSVPLLLWKWQSDLWIVYSYGKEGFDFKHPHLVDFLFSYQKGWFLWNPLSFIAFLGGLIYFYLFSKKTVLQYFLPIAFIVYILSSWWCWTYGSGFGQRTMIEYLPFIIVGFALFSQKYLNPILLFLTILLFSVLNIIQSYQISEGIIKGGLTTEKSYWSHFLQLKKDAPIAIKTNNMHFISCFKNDAKSIISEKHPYSNSIKTKNINQANYAIIELTIGAKNGNKDIRLVVTNEDGSFYNTEFIGNYLYETPRKMSFKFHLKSNSSNIITYVWNGDTKVNAEISTIAISLYRYKK